MLAVSGVSSSPREYCLTMECSPVAGEKKRQHTFFEIPQHIPNPVRLIDSFGLFARSAQELREYTRISLGDRVTGNKVCPPQGARNQLQLTPFILEAAQQDHLPVRLDAPEERDRAAVQRRVPPDSRGDSRRQTNGGPSRRRVDAYCPRRCPRHTYIGIPEKCGCSHQQFTPYFPRPLTQVPLVWLLPLILRQLPPLRRVPRHL